MLRRFAVLSLAAASACGGRTAAAPAPAPTMPTPTDAVAAITVSDLRRDLSAFAADSMRGRETGTPDARRAAAFIAERLAQIGLEPAGDSLYFQRVPMVRDRFTSDTRFVAEADGRSTTLALGTDIVPLTSLGEGAPEPRRNVEGELVFAGYGVQSKALGRDDLAGIDVRGKVVVVLHGAPASADSATKARLEAQAELSTRLGLLIPRGPAAVILLMTDATAPFYRQAATSLLRQVSLRDGRRFTQSDAERPLPMILLGVATPGSPLLPARWPADDRAQSLPGRTFSGHIEMTHEPVTGYNVVAIARGRDRALNGSFVAFGAHYDHIGVQPAMDGETDTIANGADDDGSGSMALLAIARAMQAAPPRRSALFVWHVGEEKGLLGSSYFTAHPTVPIDSIVAQLNADMIGRNAPGDLYIVGPRAAPNGQSRVLGAIVDSVNAARPQPFRFDREWDATDHPEQIYQRSDHFNYAKKGIPIVFFTTGLHPQYHRVTDEVSLIDFEKLANVARLMEEVGRAVGNRGTRPR